MSSILVGKLGDTGWSEEYDCVPLRLRLQILRSRVIKQDLTGAAAGDLSDHEEMFTETCVGREEEGILSEEVNNEQRIYTPKTSEFETMCEFPNHTTSDSGPRVSLLDDAFSNSAGCPPDSHLELTSGIIGKVQDPAFEARVENSDGEMVIDAVGMSGCQTSTDVGDNVQQKCSVNNTALTRSVKAKKEIFLGFDNDLDNIVLGERRKFLLSRKLMESSGSFMVEDDKALSQSSKIMMHRADMEKQECDSIQDMPIYKSICSLPNVSDHCDANRGSDRTSFKKNPQIQLGSTSSSDDSMINAVLQLPTKVKDEPVDASDLCSDGKNGMVKFSVGAEIQAIKIEHAFSDPLGDELDHLPLADRVKLLSSRSTDLEIPYNHGSFKDGVDDGADIFESFQPVSKSRPLKRRKTATNIVEIALEEDAPGLLKVLIERGIFLDEIKLYGQEESDGDLEDSFSEDGFAELEAVMSQIFTQRPTFLKFPLLRTKSGKISYCLSCLLSLVEQTRYLQNRKWPVEWGWCRDLQSFIFVFHRHNRIVLERPEYGYATYFFELLNSVPVAWQIKRLVTAMKLTNCGRITLLENKPLVVGDDLSEGEARVLAEYGWTPNTGLGTMLNYCDRVYHDRKQETDNSEWRSKIGRQLMDGISGGNIISKSLPKKLIEYQGSEDVLVKLEQ